MGDRRQGTKACTLLSSATTFGDQRAFGYPIYWCFIRPTAARCLVFRRHVFLGVKNSSEKIHLVFARVVHVG